MAMLSTHAQSATLQVTRIFDGKVVPTSRMVLTRVRGKALSKYQLSFYRSARFQATEAEAREVNALVMLDKRLSDKARLSSKTVRKTHEQSIVFGLPAENQLNRYICLHTKTEGRATIVTVIYMEGTVKDVLELNKLINK